MSIPIKAITIPCKVVIVIARGDYCFFFYIDRGNIFKFKPQHHYKYRHLKHKCKIMENEIAEGDNVINHNTVSLLNNQGTGFVAASRR